MRDDRQFNYLVDASDRIVFANNHWYDFARENGAAHLNEKTVPGRVFWDFIVGRETRELYRVLMKSVRERGGTKTIPFRCDAPDRRRHMEMTISHGVDGRLAFTSRIIRQEERDPCPELFPTEPRSGDLLVMCGWCKKVRVDAVVWVEVEEAIKQLRLFHATALPRISHGICDPCTDTLKSYVI